MCPIITNYYRFDLRRDGVKIKQTRLSGADVESRFLILTSSRSFDPVFINIQHQIYNTVVVQKLARKRSRTSGQRHISDMVKSMNGSISLHTHIRL